MSSVNCADSGPTAKIVFAPWILTTLSPLMVGRLLWRKSGSQLVSAYPDIHLQWLSLLSDEECRELIYLFVVLDDWR